MSHGGAERVISILSNEFAERNYEVSICQLLKNEIGYKLNPSIKVIDFSNENNSRIKNLPLWIKSIRNFVKKENPDAVISFIGRINIVVLLACAFLNKKIIVSERNDPRYDGRGKMADIMTRILYPSANRIVFQTRQVKSLFGKKIQTKSVIIPNPIDVKAFAENSDSKTIVSVGRLSAQKNQKMLIEAFSQVIKLFPDMKLVIYGEGELRDDLQYLIAELGLNSSVSLPGEVSNIHECLKSAEMFVLSSDYEGLSNALLEAMCMGLPCVSTACAGSDEYIISGENGILTPVGDKEALINAIIKFVENKELKELCGKNAHKVSSKVSTDNVIYKWLELI